MSVGRDLLDLPFAELVRNLAVAIADGQTALDRNSVETMKVLAATTIPLLTDVTEIIEPTVSSVQVQVQDSGGGSHQETIQVTGARVRTSDATTAQMTMLQAGIMPTFYQFTEASIEVKLSITMEEDRGGAAAANANDKYRLGQSRARAASIDLRTQNKYTYQANGSSTLKVVMRPVPPPTRMDPTVTTVNMLTNPPTVTRNPS
jgi:hypothetical protein